MKITIINRTTYIGIPHIGLFDPGKLADLIMIYGNPLEDIYDTGFVEYTMINGRLNDADTMNEIGNYE